MNLEVGRKYKWKHDQRVLCYIGMKGGWHQFALNGAVWCEVLNSDLHLMEQAL